MCHLVCKMMTSQGRGKSLIPSCFQLSRGRALSLRAPAGRGHVASLCPHCDL